MNMILLYSLSLSLSLSLKRSASEGYRFEAHGDRHQFNCVLTGSLRIQSNNILSAIT